MGLTRRQFIPGARRPGGGLGVLIIWSLGPLNAAQVETRLRRWRSEYRPRA